MKYVLREADKRNLPIITLTVLKDNSNARKLYEKMGFEIKGEETFRQEKDSHYMERRHNLEGFGKVSD
jgi:ribosomal protein S18 acetylase RimI-like enzyme